MLTSLFPNTHTRYPSLPVLGAFLEDLLLMAFARLSAERDFSADGSRPVSRKMFAGATNHVAVRLHGGASARMLAAAKVLDSADRLRPRPIFTDIPPRTKGVGVRTTERIGTTDLRLPRTPRPRSRIRRLHYRTARRRCRMTFCAFSSATMTSSTCRRFRLVIWRRSSSKPALAWLPSLCRRSSPSCDPFWRFLAASGKILLGIDRHLDSPRHHRGERLARALRWEDILALLRGIDRSTVKGCRDYAMLLLIATYGLRRSEVSSLDIDDIQWRARTPRAATQGRHAAGHAAN